MTALTRRRAWAYGLTRRCATPPPSYGSEDWLDLPDGSPEKIAAVVIAAECWARTGDNLEDDLRRELDAAREAEERRLDELHAENVASVHDLAKRPHVGTSYAERRARELADAVRPRPGDFPGKAHLRSIDGGGDAA